MFPLQQLSVCLSIQHHEVSSVYLDTSHCGSSYNDCQCAYVRACVQSGQFKAPFVKEVMMQPVTAISRLCKQHAQQKLKNLCLIGLKSDRSVSPFINAIGQFPSHQPNRSVPLPSTQSVSSPPINPIGQLPLPSTRSVSSPPINPIGQLPLPSTRSVSFPSHQPDPSHIHFLTISLTNCKKTS